MNIFVALIMMVVSYLIQMAIQPKPETPKPGKLDVPVAEEGGNIPVVFGTVMIKSSNIIGSGNAKTVPIKKSSGKK